MKKICTILFTIILVCSNFSGVYAASSIVDTSSAIVSDKTTLPKNVVIMINRINKERELKGLAALTFDEKLLESAQLRANEVAIKWSHTRPNGKKWHTISKYAHGENLAMGHKTADSVVDDWMNSKGHRGIILNDQFTKIGAYNIQVNGKRYWVVHMGRENPTK